MDPLSISTGALSIASNVGKLSLATYKFIKHFRAARGDLDAVCTELASLQRVLELLADDLKDAASQNLPETLLKQISGILGSCDGVVVELTKVISKYEKATALTKTQWALSGRETANKLRSNLAAHNAALDIALEMLMLSIAKGIKQDTYELKNDTSQIKADTGAIREDTGDILALIVRLEALQTSGAQRSAEDNFLLQRYLDGLTTYAGSVCGRSVADPLEHYQPFEDAVPSTPLEDASSIGSDPTSKGFTGSSTREHSLKSQQTRPSRYSEQGPEPDASENTDEHFTGLPSKASVESDHAAAEESKADPDADLTFASAAVLTTSNSNLAKKSSRSGPSSEPAERSAAATVPRTEDTSDQDSECTSQGSGSELVLLPKSLVYEREERAKVLRKSLPLQQQIDMNLKLRMIVRETDASDITKLLALGADPNWTILEVGNRATVALSRFQDSEGPKPWSWTTRPLLNAAASGNCPCLTALLNYGADPNADTRIEGNDFTPLQLAVASACSVCVELLLEAGARLRNISYSMEGNPMETTLLHKSAALSPPSDVSIARSLILGGMNVDIADSHFNTALFTTIKSCASDENVVATKLPLVEFLLKMKANPNSTSRFRRARSVIDLPADVPLIEAIRQGIDYHRPLAGYPESFNTTTGRWTKELSEERFELIRLLLRHGADVNAVNHDSLRDSGFTAVMWATKQRMHDLMGFLIENGANLITPTPAIQIAIQNLDCRAIKLLLDKMGVAYLKLQISHWQGLPIHCAICNIARALLSDSDDALGRVARRYAHMLCELLSMEGELYETSADVRYIKRSWRATRRSYPTSHNVTPRELAATIALPRSVDRKTLFPFIDFGK